MYYAASQKDTHADGTESVATTKLPEGSLFSLEEIGPVEQPPTVSHDKLRRIELSHVKTIRPSLVPKHRDLIPVFYQRNPNKTRNYIAHSLHAISLVQEERSKSEMGFVQDPE